MANTRYGFVDDGSQLLVPDKNIIINNSCDGSGNEALDKVNAITKDAPNELDTFAEVAESIKDIKAKLQELENSKGLEDFITKEEVDKKFETKVNKKDYSDFVNNVTGLLNTVIYDLYEEGKFALKDDLHKFAHKKDLHKFITRSEAAFYISKPELEARLLELNFDNYVSKEELKKTIDNIDLSKYATIDEYSRINGLVNTIIESLWGDEKEFITKDDLKNQEYLTRTEIPNLIKEEGLATVTYIDNKVDEVNSIKYDSIQNNDIRNLFTE